MSRVMFISFTVVGLMLGWSGVSRSEDNCKAILAKAIQAHGGADKLSKIHAIQFKTTEEVTIVSINDTGTISYEISMLFPDKYKCHKSWKLPQGASIPDTITVYNQGKGSRSEQNNEKEVGEVELNEIKERIHRMHVTTRLASLQDPAYALSPLAEEKVANKPAAGFKVKAKGFRDLDLFFDKESGLLVKMRYETGAKQGNKITEEMIVKEYQKLDGIYTPKKILKIRDGKKTQDVEYTEIKLLPSMDEKEFDAPSLQ